MAQRPKTVIRQFLNRYIFTANHAVEISLHAGSTNSTPLLTRCITEHDINDLKGMGMLDGLVDEFLAIINEDDDPDEDDDGYILHAELRDGEHVATRPMRPRNGHSPEKHLLAQCYRHLERALTVNHAMVDSVMKHGTTQMYHARQMAEESFETRARLLTTEQDLADRSHERLLEAKKEEQSAEFRQAIMNGVAACFPMLAGKLAGIMPLGAEAVRASPHYQTIKSIFEGVPQEHWPLMHAWLQSCPLGDAEKSALNHVIDSIMNDMVEGEKKKASNGKKDATSGN